MHFRFDGEPPCSQKVLDGLGVEFARPRRAPLDRCRLGGRGRRLFAALQRGRGAARPAVERRGRRGGGAGAGSSRSRVAAPCDEGRAPVPARRWPPAGPSAPSWHSMARAPAPGRERAPRRAAARAGAGAGALTRCRAGAGAGAPCRGGGHRGARAPSSLGRGGGGPLRLRLPCAGGRVRPP